jgi:hypothetical protein
MAKENTKIMNKKFNYLEVSMLWQGKSKFYKDFMKSLITDILAVIL